MSLQNMLLQTKTYLVHQFFGRGNDIKSSMMMQKKIYIEHQYGSICFDKQKSSSTLKTGCTMQNIKII